MIRTNDLLNSQNFENWIKCEKLDINASYPMTIFSKFIDECKMDTCVDLGSNVGLFSYKASKYYNKVYGFEAAYLTSLASRNFAVNSLQAENIFFYNLAVDKTSGNLIKLKSQINDEIYVSGNNSTKIKDNDLAYEYCLSISLQDIYKLLQINFIDYLKIDIEGSEYDVLLDQDLSKIGIISGEVHGINETNFEEDRNKLFKYLENYFVMYKTEHTFFGVSNKFKNSLNFIKDLYQKIEKRNNQKEENK